MAKYKTGDIIYFEDRKTLREAHGYFPPSIETHKLLILKVKLNIRKKFTEYDLTLLDLNTGETIAFTLRSDKQSVLWERDEQGNKI